MDLKHSEFMNGHGDISVDGNASKKATHQQTDDKSMKLVALISGGKDSTFCCMHAHALGHTVVALANLKPPAGVTSSAQKESAPLDELDSFMYQTVGHDGIELYQQCFLDGTIPLFRTDILGSSLHTHSITYQEPHSTAENNQDEVEDLYRLLSNVKSAMPKVTGVAVGAILSTYQRVRVESVCSRLGLTCLAFLWQQNQLHLLDTMIASGLEAVLIKVASIGLEGRKHLGASLSAMHPSLLNLFHLYGSNVCGEGGEYESFTLDCPLFGKKLVLDQVERVIHSDDPFAQVSYLRIKSAHVESKDKASFLNTLENFGKALVPDRQLLPSIPEDDVSWKAAKQASLSVLRAKKNNSLSTLINIDTDLEVYTAPRSQAHIQSSSLYHWIGSLKTIQAFDPLEYAQMVDSTFAELQLFMNTHKLDWSDLLLMHVYVSDMSHFATLNKTYGKYFQVNPPSRVTVQAPIGKSGWTSLQMDCIVRPSASLRRETLHVQSISYWAPANIGPYSQASLCGPLIFLAGQIGLIPEKMQLPVPEQCMPCAELVETELNCAIAEAHLSVSHVASVLTALSSSLRHIIHCTCYVSSPGFISVAEKMWKARFEQEGCNEGNIPSCLFLVMPALPKGAKIEWHVVGVDVQGCLQTLQEAQILSPEGEDDGPLPTFDLVLAQVSKNATIIQSVTPELKYSIFTQTTTVMGQTGILLSCSLSQNPGSEISVTFLRGMVDSLMRELLERAGDRRVSNCRIFHPYFISSEYLKTDMIGTLTAAWVPVMQIGLDKCVVALTAILE